MEPSTELTIGQLAQLTGVSVKTIRFYADEGLVPEAGRTRAGYRLFDRQAAERLAFVRTLRELGFDLPTVKQVLHREASLPEIARGHAQALDTHIRVLELRRAVLRLVAAGPGRPAPEEVARMDKLVQASNEERARLLADFLDDVFDGLAVDPAFVDRMRQVSPALPEHPSPEQVDAWVELAGLLRDDSFRRRIRQMAEQASAQRGANPQSSDEGAAQAHLMAQAGAAVQAGTDPRSPEAAPIVDGIVQAFARAQGREDSPAYRAWLATTLDTFTDRRAERYWQLLGVINGWPPIPSSLAAWEWVLAALRA